METEKNNSSIEKEIEEILKELLGKMGFSCEVEARQTKEDEKEAVLCNLKTDDPSFLIGQYGINLQSLQHIARVIVRKRIPSRVNFVLDVNNYRQEKNESVIKLAKSLAFQAVSERRAVVMRPMSPYERRIVHLELSKNDQIKTESIGEGEDRRVVIKPADLV